MTTVAMFGWWPFNELFILTFCWLICCLLGFYALEYDLVLFSVKLYDLFFYENMPFLCLCDFHHFVWPVLLSMMVAYTHP